LVLQAKKGPIPEPLSPFHVILELAVTYELKAISLARAGSSELNVLDGDGVGGASLSQDELMGVFTSAPSSASECAYGAMVGYM
jgi:hypothetical protein